MKTPELIEKFVSKVGKNFENFKDVILAKYGSKPGNMLVHTGVLGWILSSLAQITAVAFNDKIPTEQKVFLIPQEIADAATNILSFYIVTNSVKSLASKFVTTGKLTNPTISKFLNDVKGLDKSKIGTWDFDITKLKGYDSIKTEFTNFKNGIDVPASIAGSVLSCNIITPLIRNRYAAEKQKDVLAKMHTKRMNFLQTPSGISMETYLNRIYAKSPSLKV